MKKISVLVLCFLLFSCKEEKAEEKTAVKKEEVSAKQPVLKRNNEEARSEKDIKTASIEGEYGSTSNYVEEIDEAQGVEGEGEREGYLGSFSIEKIKDNKYYFEILIGSPNCTGEVDGYFVLDENGMGKYSSEDCLELVFKFGKDTVEVTESDCGLHGMSCSFADTYVKNK